MPAALAGRLFEEAPRFARDESFVVRVADSMPLGAFEVFDVAVRNSATVREALERTCRHHALIDDRTELTLFASDAAARLVCKNPAMPRASRILAELLFTTIVRRLRQLTGREAPLLAVHFAGAGPRDASTHERFFRVPLSFWAPVDQLLLDRPALEQTLPDADPMLATLFDRGVPRFALGAQPAPIEPLLAEARTAVREVLGERSSGIEVIARRLHLTPRTLQRKLKSLGTTYAALVDDVRLDRAMEELADPERGIREIGAALGFAEVSAFHHAFKRWTGLTPVAFRRNAATQGRRAAASAVRSRSQSPPFGEGSDVVCPSGNVRSPK